MSVTAESAVLPPPQGTRLPDPLPLGVGVIDSAILLFGKAFPAVASKHRQQLLSHFKDCVRQAKSVRQDTIQINIFTAFLAALKVWGCGGVRVYGCGGVLCVFGSVYVRVIRPLL